MEGGEGKGDFDATDAFLQQAAAAAAAAAAANGSRSPAKNDRSRSPARDKGARRSRSRSRSRSPGRRRDRSRSPARRRDRDRGSSSRRDRKKSPEPRKLMRTKPSPNWDVPPAGYETMAPEQYKAIMAPRTTSTSGSAAGSSVSLPLDAMGSASSGQNASQLTRQSRRLYVGNLPVGFLDMHITDYFNEQMLQLNLGTSPGNPVVQTQLNMEKGFAFVEFRSIEEATQAMALDGITFQGQALRIRRPKDYVAPYGTVDPPSLFASQARTDTVPRLLVTGFPPDLNAEQIQELLASFGPVSETTLLKDPSTNEFNGQVLCAYVSGPSAEQALLGLADLEIGPSRLQARRATAAPTHVVAPISLPPPTRVLALLNMVMPEELQDDDEYQDILVDVREECEKHGRVSTVKIPRDGPGLGKIFVEFTNIMEAQRAAAALSGRSFAGRKVGATFVPEEKFARDDFD